MACDFLENFLIRHCKICMSSYEYVRILKVCVQNQEKKLPRRIWSPAMAGRRRHYIARGICVVWGGGCCSMSCI